MEVGLMYTKEQILKAAEEIGLAVELAPEGTKAAFVSPDGTIYSKLEDNPVEDFLPDINLNYRSFGEIEFNDYSEYSDNLEFSNEFNNGSINKNIKKEKQKDASLFCCIFMLL